MYKTKTIIKIIYVMFITYISLNAQGYDFTYYFNYGPVGHINWIDYDYKYIEFHNNAYLDSSIVLTSYEGTLTVSIFDGKYDSDTLIYRLKLLKDVKKIERNYFDTLSIENIQIEEIDSVYTIQNVYENGNFGHIFGWIFPDTLDESIADSLDSIPTYQYSKLYANYEPYFDSTLNIIDDTLFIHYRPITTNFNDSYYSIDYALNLNKNVRSYTRYYSYFGVGFYESLRFKGGGWASVKNQNIVPNNISLSQNYPNPFNPITKIKYSIKTKSKVHLIIYDLLGNEIQTLIDDIKNSGDYEIEFNASKLSSGIYFYKLISENSSITKKLVVLK